MEGVDTLYKRDVSVSDVADPDAGGMKTCSAQWSSRHLDIRRHMEQLRELFL
jgi:hypothetical protein